MREMMQRKCQRKRGMIANDTIIMKDEIDAREKQSLRTNIQTFNQDKNLKAKRYGRKKSSKQKN